MHEGHAKEHNSPEPKLILGYMLEHNRQHAADLDALAGKLDAAGCKDAAALVREATSAYEQGNDKLEKALQGL